MLLAIGSFGAFFGVISGASFEEGFVNGMEIQGYSVANAPEGVGSYGLAIALSHVLLYLAAVGISIPLLVKKKMVFYVPLSAGVLAAVIYWGLAIIAGAVYASEFAY